MQQRLMLRRRSLRCRDRCHRLHALAPTRGHQSGAVVAQWPSTIRVTDHPHKTLDISPKPRFNALSFAETHPNPLYLNGNCLRYLILKPPYLRLSDSPSDSVVLVRMHQMTPKNGSALTPPSVNLNTAHRMCHSNC